ncbi:anhydro-N-acetylmuramic acid kinase [Aquibaculum arenosum]|uniref:Anhydro-N-acetylmuramic acid kinase n=1 Tax=Aquibaculum arenosum TaxID=3032591 RepID=A0ABT5YMB7_9PROT|nr:anhydro-N-acetylmuramic acid kinase [Fodinicurvata sp. CAU 1616]MDF2095988.1 anhydro-N-acetylmuramic acid kinase [Fodinicurvata sp. CAU 1616]
MALYLGLMSGTSLDGIDAALLETDGAQQVNPGASHSVPYDPAFRERLRALLGGRQPVAEVEQELTHRHAEAVGGLLALAGIAAAEVTALGFHGQTILHEPDERRTWQIGDGELLARLTGIPVVCDFRSADVAAGGQGAPLAPLYHAARLGPLPRPAAVLNLGGVGNVTWIGEEAEALLAFDTGPGNALLDDWARRRAGQPCDLDGALAAAGRVDRQALASLLNHPYFDTRPPKSLDRDAFDPTPVEKLSSEDGAATLAAFTVESVVRALDHFPAPPRRWLVTGGGRRNPVLMRWLAERLGAAVEPVEALGWNGDALEAEAFAYLAARSLAGLPLSLPGTTGVPSPTTGGRIYRPPV